MSRHSHADPHALFHKVTTDGPQARVYGECSEGADAAARVQAAHTAVSSVLGAPTAAGCGGWWVGGKLGGWGEVARAQVHGFGIRCAAFVGGRAGGRHSFASGADDEKVLPCKATLGVQRRGLVVG